ncbi:MAG TPA: excinuclease ABC subunit UvrB [Candidatus Paceibacterota bacterium]|nr:excinuclease ABC subunit UvrB [Candidatus Paceibacterota bacterium]
MGIFKLKSSFQPTGDQPQAIDKLVRGLEKNLPFQTLLGVTGSGKTFTMANAISHFDKPVLVMAPNKSLAAQLYNEYKNFFPENSVNYFVSYYDYYQPEAYLPTTDTYIDKEATINEEIDKLRHRATTALMTRRDVIVVASVSCIYNLGLPTNYWQSALHLEVGQLLTRGDLLKQLIKLQFTRTNSVIKRGFFRTRGDIVEIMPASGDHIFRVELKNQRIETINLVDSQTLNIKENLTEAIIFPSKHFVATEPQREKAIENIKAELDERLQYFRKEKLFLEEERLKRRTVYDLEMLRSIGYCHGIENYSRHLNGKLAGEPPDTLLEYFPKKDGRPDFLTIMDESHIGLPQVRGMYEGDRSRKKALVEYGWRLPSALDNRPLKFNEFLERIGNTIFTSATPGEWEINHSGKVVEQVIRPTGLVDPQIEIRPVFDKDKNRSQINDFIDEITALVKKKERVMANVLTKSMAEDLTEFLKKKGFKCQYMHSDTLTIERTRILTDFRKGKYDVLIGVNLLREGLDLPEVTLVAIFDADREGFLRNESSLIQTMGRASRNVSGKVILYADTITGSIKNAMREVERRRKIQLAYNKKNHITPTTIKKSIENLLNFD